MPKPSDNAPDWASDDLYTSGPDTGKPTKYTIPDGVAAQGHRGGKNDPTAAQPYNDFLHKVARLCRWVFAGSSSGAADAHVVETNSIGSSSLQHIVVLGDGAPTQPAVSVFQPVNAHGVRVTGNAASNDAAVKVTHAGTGIAVEVDTNNGQPGGKFTGTTGLLATGVGSGAGLVAVSGPSATAAVEAVAAGTNTSGINAGGTGTAPAVIGTAGGTGPGGKFVAGTGPGVRGESTTEGLHGHATDPDGFGVVGGMVAGGTISGGGVAGIATGAAVGGFFLGVDGVGMTAQNNGTRPTTVHTPVSSDPGTHIDGGMWYRNGIGHSVRREGATRRLHDSAKGRVYKHAYSETGSTTSDYLAPALIATISLSGGDAPSVVGDVILRFVADIGRSSDPTTFGVKLIDLTAPVAVYDTHEDDDGIQLFRTGAGVYERTVEFVAVYPLPAPGARTFEFRYFVQNPGAFGDSVRYRRALCSVEGIF